MKIEKIGLVIILIGFAWMIGRVIYGIGLKNGYEIGIQKQNEEIIMEYEQMIDEIQDKCDEKVEEAKQEILNMF